MPVTIQDLAPYKSVLLCRAPTRWRMPAAIAELRVLAQGLNSVVQAATPSPPAVHDGLRISFFHYAVDRHPSWLVTDELTDREWHVVIVGKRGEFVFLLASDSRVRDRVLQSVNQADGTSLGSLSLVPAAVLNAAFVRGRTKTLWMASTQRRTSTRADSKTLGGTDLQFAIDPLGDQCFCLSAAVSELPNNAYRQPVGTSPRKGQIWAGASTSFTAFCADINLLLDLVGAVNTPVANPLPALASPVLDGATMAVVGDAFEAAVIPDVLLQTELDPTERTWAERWSLLKFDVTGYVDTNFQAALSLPNGTGGMISLGDVRVELDVTRPSRISWEVSSVSCPADAQELHDQACDMLRQRPEWLRVWYGSGHTLVGESIVGTKLRDLPFSYKWVDFNGFDVSKEKPSPLGHATIGQQDSLFCWVKTRWTRSLATGAIVSGWLACNDGSMEIADFIHFDMVDSEPELTLIHVKGSSSTTPNRALSLGDYELVVAQALKNLHYLDALNTADGFVNFLQDKIMNAVWYGNVQRTRADMLTELRRYGTKCHRRVVIVQPRATRRAVSAARTASDLRSSRTVKQLDSLLVAAKSSFQSLAADLVVIGDSR